jgi:hypothetical protein
VEPDTGFLDFVALPLESKDPASLTRPLELAIENDPIMTIDQSHTSSRPLQWMKKKIFKGRKALNSVIKQHNTGTI